MKLTFITEARFIKDEKGHVYGESAFSYTLWQRYLTIFTHIYVMARVTHQEKAEGTYSFLSSGEDVTFVELPYYIGPLEYLKKRKALNLSIKNALNQISDCVFVCRVPGILSNIAIKHLKKEHKQFGVEVVGDPWEVFSTLKHPLGFFLKHQSYIALRKNVSSATAALYVTNHSLQKRYPIPQGSFQVAASDVIIKDNQIAVSPKTYQKKECYEILSVGSLAQLYKAPDILIEAIKILKDEGLKCKLTWLGDGLYLKAMKDKAIDMGVGDLVKFKGNVDSIQVRNFLLQSDIFALISRTEGLPRAMIEAMSVGLPCIGTKVGGIPELLQEIVLVPKNDATSTAKKIATMICQEDLYNQQAIRNLEESHHYKESVLSERRNSFYNYLIDNVGSKVVNI